VGLDLGTTIAKAAAFDARGVQVAGSRVPMPPLVTQGQGAWQETGPILEAAVSALEALELAPGSVALVALTGQRDTSLLVDGAGHPVTPLLSWRDTRGVGHPSLWDVLLEEEPALRRTARGARSLTSWLAEAWTGHPAETLATLPVSLQGGSWTRLEALLPPGAVPGTPLLPTLVPIGAPLAPLGPGLPDAFRGVPFHLTAGDKNCEYLAMGIDGPGRGGISLGSAISFGILSSHRGEAPPAVPRGVVPIRGALAERWNLETGLLGGMDGRSWLEGILAPGPTGTGSAGGAIGPGAGPSRDVPWVDDLWCLPHFAGALDHAGATGTLVGLREGVTPGDVLQAWMQGVAGELRRLRPLLEEAGGEPLSQVVVGGGGAGDDEGGRWGPLLALALTLPVEVVDDPWTGCRGAVLTTLSGESGLPVPEGWKAPSTRYRPEEEHHNRSPEEVRRYFARYDALVEALAGTVLSGFQGSSRSS